MNANGTNSGTISAQELIETMVLVNIEISIWSAKRKMTPEDFGGAHLPPDQLASLGSKNVFDPKKIDEFCRIRSEVHSFMRRNAVRFGSGYIINEDKLAEIVFKMDEMKAEFTSKLQTFMASYDEALNDWLSDPENLPWQHIISGSTVDREYVASKMKFRWHALKLLPAGSASDFMEDVESLPHLLFEEIADEARKLLETTVGCKREEATQKALRPYRTISEKLQSLSFIDPRVAALKQGIDGVLATMPAKGKLAESDLIRLRELTMTLSSSVAAMKYADSIMKGSIPVAQSQTQKALFPSPSSVLNNQTREEILPLLPFGDTEEQSQDSEEYSGILPLAADKDRPDEEIEAVRENILTTAVKEESEVPADLIPHYVVDGDLLDALGF